MKHYHPTEAAIWDYVSKSADSNTVKEVEQWINSAEYDKTLFEKITGIYNLTGENPYVTDIQIDASKKLFFDTLSANKSTRHPWRNVLKYAAILVFSIAVVTYAYERLTSKDALILVQTTYAEQKEITLSDGTIVWLNASSTLSYNKKSPRTLNLDGEAFFKVAKDKDNLFAVTTPDNIEVKALGTSFNVKSYGAHSYTETILYTGKVAITSTNQFTDVILMNPKDKVTFYRNDKRIVRNTHENTSQPIAWRSGLIKFNNQSFKDISDNLNIQYNIKIRFENESISNSKFTGSFDAETPINELLNVLKASKEFEFKQTKENEWIIK